MSGVISWGYDADIGPGHFTAGHQIIHDLFSQIDGDGKTDSDIASAGAGDGAVDPDHLAIDIEQGAATIAGVDGSIGLDKILIDWGICPKIHA